MPGGPRVVLATSAMGLVKDADLPLIVTALHERGVDVVAAPWDIDDFDWSRCTAAVIRSTWGYSDRLPEYLGWVDAVASVTQLHNPASLVRWNTDKRYLPELGDRGVAVVPTRFIAPGEDVVLPERGHFVVKPAVSEAARNTARYAESHHEPAARHVAALHAAGATAMVQPYFSRIDEGERALVFIDGAFSHAMRKGPVLTDIAVIDNNRIAHPGLAPHEPSDAEMDLAAAALTAARAASPTREPLYARVDIALADDGSPVLMELELIEPNLFLAHSRAGLLRFADAVSERVLPG